jgi:hypothetical protein
MRAVRWILLLLYLTLVGSLSAVALTSGEISVAITLCVTLIALALFILGAGNKNLFRPIGRPRILLPIVSTALMLAALLTGLTFALAELFYLDMYDENNWTVLAFWGSLLASWIFWAIVLSVYTRKMPRYQTIFRLGQLIFAGSIAELLASVPSHIFVSKRGGCFAGVATSMGLLAGVLVMIWSFGPAIFLLFLRGAYRGDRNYEEAAAIASPSVPKRFQFRLRTLLLVLLFASIVCAFLRAFWGEWPIAVAAAWAVLLLVTPLLMARPRIMLLALPVVFAGLLYACWGEWNVLTILAIPTCLFGMVFLKLALGGSIPRPATGRVRNGPFDGGDSHSERDK